MSAATTQALPRPGSRVRLFFDVFKLRIGLVIAVTALMGAAVTPGAALPLAQGIALFVGVALAAAAAGGFNQFVERDIDARMKRTRHRAFVTGRLAHDRGWLLGMAAMAASGVLLVAVAINLVAAVHTFLGAFIYGVVYTVWLKRITAWNIVVGGLAGSFAVLAGAAAVAPEGIATLPMVFAVVLFLWTPPHFWSLAMACRDDYVAAGIPMLPVKVGNARAAQVVLASAIALVAASIVPAAFGMSGIYLAGALLGGLPFLWTSLTLVRSPSRDNAMRNFHMSLAQLTCVLLAGFADTAWHG